MPASKTAPKPAPALKRGFKAEAERIAAGCRKDLGLADYSPLPASRLADHLGIRILTPREIPGMSPELLRTLLEGEGKDQWSAAIFMKNGSKFIIHNPTHSPARQESDLMHELAHALCNHRLSELGSAINEVMIPLREYNHEQEAEAEYLGGCLQLPRKALYHYYHILKKSNDEIAQIFNASKKMVLFRLSITGVTHIKFRR